MTVLALVLAAIPVSGGVTVVGPRDVAGFTVDRGISPLTVETRGGREALHLHLTCTDTGVRAIRYRFDQPQDWAGYDTVHFPLYATTSGTTSHIQLQLLDSANKMMVMRRDLRSSHLNRWMEVSFDFRKAGNGKGRIDFSKVKMVLLSAWQDHYGHGQGMAVDYWIGPVIRERAWSPCILGAAPSAIPPILDGRLDDACWADTPVAEQFYRHRSRGVAGEASDLRLLWDRRNIYVGVRCHAAVLDPARQRLDEFVAKQTEHDGPVFRDDCVEIFLGRADLRDYRQFATNAIGTRYDGLGTDGTWDSAWQTGCATDNGFWTMEAAIPWSDLGIDPAAGDMIAINVCRSNKAQQEATMWSPVTNAFHAPDEFGRVLLLPDVPQAEVRSGLLPPMMMGDNIVKVPFRGRRHGRISLRWLFQQGEQRREGKAEVRVSPGTDGTADIVFSVREPGEFSFAYTVTDAQTDAVYYQSPKARFSTAAVATIDVQVAGRAEVFVNKEALASAGGEFATAYLTPGCNVVGLVLNGPAAPVLKIGETTLATPTAWKQSTVAPEGWLSADFDDSEWGVASIADGRIDPRAGRYARRVIAARVTALRNWPSQNEVYMVDGSAQHLPVTVTSPLSRPLRNAALVVMTSPGLSMHSWRGKTPYPWTGQWEGQQSAETEYGGEIWTRHELKWTSLQPLEYRDEAPASYANDRLHTIGLVFTPHGVGEKQVRMWVEGEDRSLLELPKALSIHVLPALTGKRPEAIEFLLCHGFGVGGYNAQDMDALLGTWAAAGFNAYIERTHARNVYYPILRKHGYRIVCESSRRNYLRKLASAENAFVPFDSTHNGRKHTFRDPAWIIDEGRKAAVDALAAYISEAPIPPDGLWWDMELGPLMNSFSQRNMARFARRYGIDAALDKGMITTSYLNQWHDYTVTMWTELAQVYREALRQAAPAARMYVYSGYQTERARRRYCIDWTRMRGACDVASAGYGATDQILSDTVKALGTTPFIAGIAYYQPPRHMNLKVACLRQLACGAKGIMHYQWTPLDGLDCTRFSEAAALVADHERFFTHGTRADEMLAGETETDLKGVAYALKADGRLLVLLLNPGSAELTKRISVTGAGGPVAEYYTGATYENGRGISITVPPHDVRALLCTLDR